MDTGHILKFLSNQQSQIFPSRRVFPQQKSGYSKQAPQWFKRKFSLQSNKGYEYKHDQTQIKGKFNYLSQRNQFYIGKQYDKIECNEKKQTKLVHNLKKGLLSEYLDNNSWMKQTVPLTGFERSQQSRKLNHKERERRIQTAQLKSSGYIAAKTASNFYSTQRSTSLWNQSDFRSTIKSNNFPFNFNPENLKIVGDNIAKNQYQRSRSISSIMRQKQKLRSQRNQLALNKICKIEKLKLTEGIKQNSMKAVDAQFVKGRMAMTAREWAGRKLSPQRSIEMFDHMVVQSSKCKRLRNVKGSLINKQVNEIQLMSSLPS